MCCKHFTKLLLVTLYSDNFRHCILCTLSVLGWCIFGCLDAHYFIFSRSLILFSFLNAYNLSSPSVNGEYVFSVIFLRAFFFSSSFCVDRLTFFSFSTRAGFVVVVGAAVYFFAFVCILSFDNQIFALSLSPGRSNSPIVDFLCLSHANFSSIYTLDRRVKSMLLTIKCFVCVGFIN